MTPDDEEEVAFHIKVRWFIASLVASLLLWLGAICGVQALVRRLHGG